MTGEHFTSDRIGGKCACGNTVDVSHFISGESRWWGACCCPWCNRKPEEPTPPMQPIGRTISGQQESMFGKGHNDD